MSDKEKDLRDFLAAMALQGFLANGALPKALSQYKEEEKAFKSISSAAYAFADAMLEARKK